MLIAFEVSTYPARLFSNPLSSLQLKATLNTFCFYVASNTLVIFTQLVISSFVSHYLDGIRTHDLARFSRMLPTLSSPVMQGTKISKSKMFFVDTLYQSSFMKESKFLIFQISLGLDNPCIDIAAFHGQYKRQLRSMFYWFSIKLGIIIIRLLSSYPAA